MGAAIEVEHVSKRFKLYHERPTSLKDRVIHLGRMSHEEFWALDDVDLRVDAGETLGLLGHNGSGKSTLLKCIAGILRPTSGQIRTAGRVVALLELGAGFHPELTGRENVYLNGTILGLSREEIDEAFDAIVAFSEIGEFIDNQIKHYSSGMIARLGFAVAVNVEPEVLLVDEVLAVGDEAFQRKCLDRIQEFQRDGRTILLVTHAADLARRVCDRVAVLDRGKLVIVAEPGAAVIEFRDSLLQRGYEAADPSVSNATHALHEVRIVGVDIIYPEPGRSHLRPGEQLLVRCRYEAPEPVEDVAFAINIHDQNGNLIFGTNSDVIGTELGSISGEGAVVFECDALPLLDGIYLVSLYAHTRSGGVFYDQRAGQDVIEVASESRAEGVVALPISVRLDT